METNTTTTADDTWNDDVIVNLFHEAISTHRTKQQVEKLKRKKIEWSDVTEFQKKLCCINEDNKESNQSTTPAEFDNHVHVVITSSTTHSPDTQSVFPSEIPPSELPSTESIPSGSQVEGNKSSIEHEAYLAYLKSQTHISLANGNPTEEALSSMLMAWYQSGYATGRYHALLELQAISKVHEPSAVVVSESHLDSLQK
jgi:hypothetical protein